MKQSDTLGKLATSLAKVHSEIKAIKPDAKNPDFHSVYISLDAIVEMVRPILSRHGLSIVQGSTTPVTDEGGKLAALNVETMLLHESGEWVMNAVIMPVLGRMLKGGGVGEVNAQSSGSAITYGRRYGLSALLSLSSDDDDDGNTAIKGNAPRAEKPPTDRLMPFGTHKGKKLGDISSVDLEKTVAWCSGDDEKLAKFQELIDSCSAVILSRQPVQAIPPKDELF